VGRAGREICLSTQRQPVYRRPELNLLASTTERVKSLLVMCRKTTSGEDHEEEYRCTIQWRSHLYER
jgi:hypothetical protein